MKKLEETKNNLHAYDSYFMDYLKANYGLRNPNQAIKCLNPNHADKHPSMYFNVKTNKLHCFACSKTYSFIDLIMQEQNLTSPLDAYNYLAKLYEGKPIPPKLTYKETPNDYTQAFLQVLEEETEEMKNKKYSYLVSRGYTLEEAKLISKLFNLTYKDNYLLIPHLNLVDDTKTITDIQRRAIDNQEPKYKRIGKTTIYDPILSLKSMNLYENNTPTFIVESELDAILLYAIRKIVSDAPTYNAIALSGKGNINIFLQALKKQDYDKYNFILMLDNDNKTDNETNILKQELDKLHIKNRVSNLLQIVKAKDPNEAFIKDKDNFINHFLKSINANEIIQPNSAYDYLDTFIKNVKSSKVLDPTRTNFTNFDKFTRGGLPKGLVILGGMSSIGKTSIALQFMDQLAQRGNDCFYYSLEVSEDLLISKSASRLTFLGAKKLLATDDNMQEEKISDLASDNLDILQGDLYDIYSKQKRELISNALEDYKSYAKHIFIKSKNEDKNRIGIEDIKNDIKEYLENNPNKKPIVFIDYLQLIAKPKPNLTDKQNMDIVIEDLANIAHFNNITIIAISALNRASYNEKVSFESFKESGLIEYSADLIIGINLAVYREIENAYSKGKELLTEREKCIQKKICDKNNKEKSESNKKKIIQLAKDASPRTIDLEIIKNKYGRTGLASVFTYYTKYNTLVETDKLTYKNDFKSIEELLKNCKAKYNDNSETLPF